MKSENVLINEIFIVKEIDMIPTKINNVLTKIKNKIFSKVSRIFAISPYQEMQILIDINTEIYKIQETDKLEFYIFHLLLSKDEDNLNKNLFNSSLDEMLLDSQDIVDSYEYVMYGTIYHSGIDGKNFFIYASFGGLLMKVFGNHDIVKTKMDLIKIDSKILLCIRKKIDS